MKHTSEMEDDEEEALRPRAGSRRAGPRFGPLLTIAVAILVLFGAASRLGKPQAGDGLFSLDLSAKSRLEEDRLRSEEERLRTIVSIGALSATAASSSADALRPSSFGSQLDPNPLPPERGDFDLDSGLGVRGDVAPVAAAPVASVASGASGMVLSIPGEIADNYDRTARFDPAPEAVPDAGHAQKTYTVRQGDTWVKVAQKTGKRWQDVQKANPASVSGLRVGMKLVVP